MRTSIYATHPGAAMIQNAVASLPEKMGRSLDEWVAFINYAGWLAASAVGKGEDGDPDKYLETAERYVEDMFAGPKAHALDA